MSHTLRTIRMGVWLLVGICTGLVGLAWLAPGTIDRLAGRGAGLNHLDIRHQIEVLEIARRLGITVVASLHDLNLAARWSNRLCLLDQGRVRAVGPPGEVLTPELIGAVYGVAVDRDTDPRTGHPRLSFHLDTNPTGDRS